MTNSILTYITKDLPKDLNDFKKHLSKKVIIFVTLTVMLETCAQICLKKGTTSKENKRMFILAGCLFYTLVGYSYYYLLTSDIELTLANNLWNVGTAITIIVSGIIFFKEKLNVKRLIGLLLAIIGIFLIG